MAVGAGQIVPVQNLGGAVSFPVGYQIEDASQTFYAFTPVQINTANGALKVWDGSTTAYGIAGVACENANNLSSAGSGAPVGFSPVIGPGSVIGSYAANPNQPYANILPPGVPTTDGRLRYFLPYPGTVFSGIIGTGAGTPAAVATAQTQVGVQYGLTLDTNGYWYVDVNKTSGNVVLSVTQLDPEFAVGTVGGRVWFTFLPGAITVNA